MRKMKRWAALLCAVLMAVTLWPMQAWAAETEDVSTVPEEALVNETPAVNEQAEDDPGTLCQATLEPGSHKLQTEELSEEALSAISFVEWDERSTAAMQAARSSRDSYFDIITVARYGRSKLAQMPRGDAYLKLYDRLLEMAKSFTTSSVKLPADESITYHEAWLITSAFCADYPELFWAWPSFIYDGSTNLCLSLVLRYNNHFSNLDKEMPLFLEAAQAYLNGMPSGSDYEKELYLHDMLIRSTTYTYSCIDEQNGYTALVEGRGVCAGYAFALQYLLMRAGIQSYYVVGDSGGDHAWNMVKIDGKWYFLDATWDDPLTGSGSDSVYSPFHTYFNLSAEMMAEDHTLSGQPYNVPLEDCTATDAFYHNVNHTAVSTSDPDLVSKVADLLQRNGGIAHLYVTDSNPVKAAREWYYENIVSIARAMQVDGGYEYGYSYSGREIILFFSGSYLSKTPGDLNGDSNITILDVDLLYQYLTTGRPTITGVMTEAQFLDNADVNGDDAIDVYDLQLLYETVCNGR